MDKVKFVDEIMKKVGASPSLRDGARRVVGVLDDEATKAHVGRLRHGAAFVRDWIDTRPAMGHVPNAEFAFSYSDRRGVRSRVRAAYNGLHFADGRGSPYPALVLTTKSLDDEYRRTFVVSRMRAPLGGVQESGAFRFLYNDRKYRIPLCGLRFGSSDENPGDQLLASLRDLDVDETREFATIGISPVDWTA